MLSAALMTLALAPQGLDAEMVRSDRAPTEEMVEFLLARDELWSERFPKQLSWTEWDETDIGPVSWKGITSEDDLRAEFVIYPLGTTRAQAQAGSPGHRGVLTRSEGIWLLVERPLPDDPNRPWSGVLGRELPARQFLSSTMNGLRAPFYSETLDEYLQVHPVVAVEDGEDRIVLDLAGTAEAASLLLEGKTDWVGGFLGIRVVFEREQMWRPTAIHEIFSAGSLGAGPGTYEIRQVDFCGAAGLVLRSFQWGGWQTIGDVRMPTTWRWDYKVEVEDSKLVPRRMVTDREIRVEALDGIPEGVSFALLPPASMGPVGRLTNHLNGTTEVFDSRPEAERLASRDEFVAQMTDPRLTPKSGAAVAPVRSWLSSILVALGSLLLLLAGHQALQRKEGAQA